MGTTDQVGAGRTGQEDAAASQPGVTPTAAEPCVSCGAELPEGARYCASCGTPTNGSWLTSVRVWVRAHRTAVTWSTVAVVVLLGLALLGTHIDAGHGSSGATVSVAAGSGGSSGVGQRWPAGVETGFLADCGRDGPPTARFCGCALERVEANYSESEFLQIERALPVAGPVPAKLRRVEAPCVHH